MHDTAFFYGLKFFDTYLPSLLWNYDKLTMVDIGSQNINGSLKELISVENMNYIGLDLSEGKNVDIVLENPYKYPLADKTADITVCSSCLEHSEFFWLTFLEMLRITKDDGLIYINAPSNGVYHKKPMDYYRFYPDAGIALQNWGIHNNYDTMLLESFIGLTKEDIWNDFVAVFIKNKNYMHNFKDRIIYSIDNFMNGYVINYLNNENILQTLKFHSMCNRIDKNF